MSDYEYRPVQAKVYAGTMEPYTDLATNYGQYTHPPIILGRRPYVTLKMAKTIAKRNKNTYQLSFKEAKDELDIQLQKKQNGQSYNTHLLRKLETQISEGWEWIYYIEKRPVGDWSLGQVV